MLSVSPGAGTRRGDKQSSPFAITERQQTMKRIRLNRAAAIVAATALAFPVAGGALAAGGVLAQPAQHPNQAQQLGATPTPEPADSGDPVEPAAALPAGSISAGQAQQLATAYVQQTAPYSSQGLTAQAAQLEDHDGTVVYTVDFTSSGGQSVQVTVSTQGQVLHAGADAADGTEQSDGGSETLDQPDAGGAQVDGTGAAGAQF